MNQRFGKLYFQTEDGQWLNVADQLKNISSLYDFKDVQPVDLGVIDYTEFTSGGTVTKFFPKKLKRNVRKRVLIMYNTMDVAPTAQRLTMNDSFIVETTRTAGSTSTMTSTIANNNAVQVLDGTIGQLANSLGGILDMPVDSFSVAFTIGATAPIKGQIKIALIEVLNK